MPKIITEFKNPNRESAIILHYICSDGRLKYYTGERGAPGLLSKATETQVNRIKKMIEGTAADYKIAGKPLLRSTLSAKLDSTFRHGKERIYLDSKFISVIEKMKSGQIMTPQNKKYSPGTVKGLRHTIRILQKFNPKMMQDAITLETYYSFIHFCHTLDYSTNYIGGQIKNWKTLGKAVGGNSIYDHEDFKIITELTPDIYLDENEIKRIFEVRLSKSLSVTRDWFVMDCYTGLRVSDLTMLDKRNVSKGMITIANEKTDATVIIPVHPFVKIIIAKYKGFPPKLSDQKLNENIKGIAKKAGIKGTVLFTITKGGQRKDEYLQKWQMVSNHTARRSFITNLLKQGVEVTLVMKLTGIKSYETIKRYNKMTSEDAAKIMSKHKFFK